MAKHKANDYGRVISYPVATGTLELVFIVETNHYTDLQVYMERKADQSTL